MDSELLNNSEFARFGLCEVKISKSTSNHMLDSVSLISYNGKKYDLSETIPTDSQLVKDQAKIIENDLQITALDEDLRRLGKFVHLACCGVVGYTELEIKTRRVLINVGDITDNTYHALRDFEATSINALKTMKTAYGFLKENLEKEALQMFQKIQEKSVEMCDICEELSKKCKDESENVNTLGGDTLIQKEITEKEKIENDKIMNQKEAHRKFHEEAIKKKEMEVDMKRDKITDTSEYEKTELENRKSLAEETDKRLQSECDKIKKHKAGLKLEYDANNKNIEKKIEESHQKYKIQLLSNKNAHQKAMQELDATFKQKLNFAEAAYKKEIQQNEKINNQLMKKNNDLCDSKIKECRENYNKMISDAEEAHQIAIEKIEKQYQDTMQANEHELRNRLALITQQLESDFKANEQKYSAKVEACLTAEAKIQEEWSKGDAEIKSIKQKNENFARSENIEAHKTIKEIRENKLSIATNDKEMKIKESEKSYQFTIKEIDKEYQDAIQASDDELANKLALATKQLEMDLKTNEQKYSEKAKACLIEKAETQEEWSKSNAKANNSKNQSEHLAERNNNNAYKMAKEIREKNITTATKGMQGNIEEAEKIHQITTKQIDKDYQDEIQISNDELANMLTLATQKLEAELEANKQNYSDKANCYLLEEAEIQEEWSKSNAKAKHNKSQIETSARSDNIEAQKLAKINAGIKLNAAFKDKESKIDEAIKVCQLASKEIDKEYQNAIQASDDKFLNRLTLAKQQLEADLEANEFKYSEKAKACLTAKAKVQEEWCNNDAEAKNNKSQSEKSARSDNIKVHETAKEIRESKLSPINEDYKAKVKEIESTYQFTIQTIDKECRDAIQASEDELRNKLMLATQNLEAELEANKHKYGAKVNSCLTVQEEWSRSNVEAKSKKQETEMSARSDNEKAHKTANATRENKLNTAYEDKQEKIAEVTKAYKFVVDNINAEYDFLIEESDKKLENNLALATKVLNEELDANQKMYSAQLRWFHFFSSRAKVQEELSNKNAQANSRHRDTEKTERSANLEARKAAQKIKEDKLNEAYGKKKENIERVETTYQDTITEIDKEYQDAVKDSNDDLKNKLKSAALKLEEEFEANESKYSEKAKVCSIEVAKIHEEWSTRDAKAKSKKSEIESSARSDMLKLHKKANEIRESKLNQAYDDKKAKIEEVEKPYQAILQEIDKEYQDAIQASDAELKNKLTTAMQKLQAELEANKRKYSEKIENCLIEEAKAQEEWSKSNDEAKNIKSKSENFAKSDNSEAHKIANRSREDKLSTEFKDKEIKIEESEKLYQCIIKQIDKEYEDAVQASDIELRNKLTLAQEQLEAELEANKHKYSVKAKACLAEETKIHEEWSKSDVNAKSRKSDSENSARAENVKTQKVAKELKDNKLNIACEAKETKVEESKQIYQLAIDQIDKEYQDTILSSDDELKSKLLLATQQLEAELEANECKYNVKVKACLAEETKVQEEWSNSDSEANCIKSESEKSARFENIASKNTAKEVRNSKLNIACKDKLSKTEECEKLYQLTIKEIDKDYQTTIQASDDELTKKLTLATQKLEIELKANERIYSEKAKSCLVEETSIREQWSKSDAEAKKNKNESEKLARSDSVEACKAAKEYRENNLTTAKVDKEARIIKAEKEVNRNITEASHKNEEFNTEAVVKQTEANKTAKCNKEASIFNAEEEKKAAELKAKENKENADKFTADIKMQEDRENKLQRDRLFQKYQVDTELIDKEFEKMKQQINDEYQKKLKLSNENLKHFKEKSTQYETDIENFQKQREESFKQMLSFVQEIKDGLISSKGHETSAHSLTLAKKALNNIQIIMRNASKFWRNVERHCTDITVKSQFSQMHTNISSREKLWHSNTFKEAALIYIGQWVCLKDKCASASKRITSVQDEINQFICDNPTKEEAKEVVKQLSAELIASIPNNMISDKPANN